VSFPYTLNDFQFIFYVNAGKQQFKIVVLRQLENSNAREEGLHEV
jgi:hypothetical protein